MKRPSLEKLPQIIIVIVIVAVGASIIIGQLGLLSPKTAARPSGPAGGTSGQQASVAAPKAAAGPGGGAGTLAAAAGRPAPASGAAGTPNAGQGAAAAVPAARAASTRTIAVRVEETKKQSLSNYTKLHGDVVSATEVKIFPSVAGKLMETKVSIGQRVDKGTVVALVDPSKVGQTYLPNPVESPVAGTILSIPVHEGDTVSSNTVIATLGDLSRLRIATAVPERFVSQLKIGGTAELSFDALPGAVFGARISSLSPVLDPISRTREVKLAPEVYDSRMLVGMFATVKLVTEMKSNVVTAPRSAVILATDESYVYVLKEDESRGTRVEKRSVTLGMEGEDAFEITKGLAVGEKVVTEGSGSVVDGDSVRVINGKDGLR